MKALLRLIAAGLGTGYAPVAPGTVGSLLAFPLWLLAGGTEMPAWLMLALSLLLVALGLFACAEGERAWGHDPGKVVIDEVAGQWVTLLVAQPVGWMGWLAAFLFFRLFDIWKPGPVDKLQQLPGAWGVMFDDLLAGLFAGLVILALRLFGLTL
jgi:phosphatidylglycerophosphatase A